MTLPPGHTPESVLVTGGGGFLGLALVRALVARGGRVRSFARRSHAALQALGIEQWRGEIADRRALEGACAGLDAVFHTTAKPPPWGAYQDYHRTNVLGTHHVSTESLAHAEALIESPSPIFVAGAGRSGLCMRAFGMRLMHLGKTVHVVGETTTPGITANDLLILGSGSGRTASLVVMAEHACHLGANVLLFTTDSESPLARLAALQVIIPAPSFRVMDDMHDSISVQPLGTLFEQSMLILCRQSRSWIDAAHTSQRRADVCTSRQPGINKERSSWLK